MALKDCIKDLGVVTKDDIALLTGYLAEGMTDEQAVQRLLIERSVDVVVLADRFRAEGFELKAPPDAIAEIRDLQSNRLEKLMQDRATLERVIQLLNFTYEELSEHGSILDRWLAQGKQLYDPIQNMEDSEILMRLGQVMFDPKRREDFKNGYVEIKDIQVRRTPDGSTETTEGTRRVKLPKGTTPKEVLASIRKMEKQRIANRKELREAHEQHMTVNGQIDRIIAVQADEIVAEVRSELLAQFMEDSKVVDENGDPLVVYHHGDFDPAADIPEGAMHFGSEDAARARAYDKDVERQQAEVEVYKGEDGKWHWDDGQGFTSETMSDKGYDSKNAAKLAGENFVRDEANNNPTEMDAEDLGNMTPAYLSIKNPMRARDQGEDWTKTIERAKELGHDGIVYTNLFEDKGSTSYIAFEPGQIKSPEATDFDPDQPSILRQGRRGSITFDDARRATINLYDAADLSTFIHEAGHLYLELFDHLYNRLDASDQILRDGKVLLEFLGVESFDDIQTKHHEKFAEAFEKYAMDGKAPSVSLQDAFNSYRTWLNEIYRKIRAIRDIELPDDIRGVMDRMLATDEEIAHAEAMQEYAPLFNTAEEMGVSEETFAVYKNSIVRAHEDAVAKESSKLMNDMKRDQEAWWKQEKSMEEAQVRLEIIGPVDDENRVYHARARLANNKTPAGLPTNKAPLKIDRDSLLELLRGDEEMMKKLPHTGAYGVYRRKNGTHVELVANELGYDDAMEMINDLLNAPDQETWIKATAEGRMRDKYPDPFKDGSMAGAAVKAVHSTHRAGVIAAEMRQLRKLMREDQPIVRATKQQAKRERREALAANKGTMPKRAEIQMIRRAAYEHIGSSLIRSVKPHVYLNAERKAARAAFIAMERQDFAAAYEAKRQQLVNFEMYRAAMKISGEMQKAQKYLATFEKRAKQERMGKGGVLNKILGILEGTDLRKRSLAEVDYLEAMKDLRTAVDEGQLVVRPETLAMIHSELVNWQNMTVDQMRGIKELVEQLEHEADMTQRVWLNDEQFKLDDIITELEDQIYDNNEEVDLYGGKKGKGQRATELKDQAIKAWLRPGTLARVLDGAGWGAFTRRFIVPIRRAYAEKYIPRIHEMQERLAGIYMDHFSLPDRETLNVPTIKVEGQNKKYTKADALALALNQGNEGNKRAIDGSLANDQPIYTKVMQDQLLGTLTARDWHFVQAIWDYFEEFYPQIAAAEERRRGVAPQRVDPEPFTVRTADGQTITLRGGYYPLHYDHALSDRVKQDKFEDINTKMGLGVYVTANTRAGSTHERVKNHGLPVRLDLNVIDIHLRDVIRDLSLGDEVQSVQKLINDKRFRAAMRKTGNLEALKVLNLWLTDAAVGEMPANHIAVKSARYIRGGFVKSKLGLSATVTLLQFTGFFQSMAAIGVKTLAIGLGKLMSNPVKWWNYVQETSHFIKARYEVGAWNRDVQDVQSHIDSWFGTVPTVAKRTFNWIGAMLFMPIKYAQKVVDVSTWLAGYEKARNGFLDRGVIQAPMSHEQAILYADAMVENAQTSGFFSDRSPLERGTLSENIRQAEYVRIWTTLIGYMLAKGNIAYEKTQDLKFKKPSTWAPWLMDMVLLFTLEGMASALIYGNWPEEDEETGETEYAKWAGKATIDSMVSGIPFIREVPQSRYGSGSTPIGAHADDWLKAMDQVGQLETDEALVKAIINVLGTAAHLPAAQTNRTLEAIWDEDGATPMEYLTGPRDEE